MGEQQPRYAYTVTAGEITPEMVTVTWPYPIESLFVSFGHGGLNPNVVYVSPERYQQIMRAYRRAQRRLWQISQKQRAQWRRRHREEKRQRAALAVQYQAKKSAG